MENMKISINAKPVEGPFGGGSQFIRDLTKYLEQSGYDVTFSLRESNVDLILMIHPNRNLSIVRYGMNAIRSYITCYPNTLLVHRVNICDSHRGTEIEDKVMLDANKLADYTVFISSFLKDYYISIGFDSHRPHTIIQNGADENVFNPTGRADWKPNEKLKIVTHHWSKAYTKGFDIYERLDLLLGTDPFRELFEFTVIGNVPKGLHFKHTRRIEPLTGTELARALKEHHVYITASRNEGAGMHHIEGMRCGLPILYLDSGALPEYCSPYGIEFTLINFEEKLLEMLELYPNLRQKVLDCPYTDSWMAAQYKALFEKLVVQRQEKPIPKPGLGKVLKQRIVIDTLRKVKRARELVQKARRYLE